MALKMISGNICSLPKDNILWQAVKLDPSHSKESEAGCWKGTSIWHECTSKLWYRNAIIRFYGGDCKWWHFWPIDRLPQLEAKYSEIINNGGKQEHPMSDSVISLFYLMFDRIWRGLS